jgi:hypothetical protein
MFAENHWGGGVLLMKPLYVTEFIYLYEINYLPADPFMVVCA